MAASVPGTFRLQDSQELDREPLIFILGGKLKVLNPPLRSVLELFVDRLA